MFKKNLKSLVEAAIDDIHGDYKEAKRVGQFKVSSKAIYKPDGTYLPFSAVTDYVHDQTSVHVSGCCAGGVWVERIIFDVDDNRFPFIFDTVKDVQKVLDLANLHT